MLIDRKNQVCSIDFKALKLDVSTITGLIQNVAQNTASRLTSDIGTTNLETAHNAFDRGLILSNQGDFAGAEKAFTEVIQIVPEAAEAHFNLGIVLLQLNRKMEGIGHIQQARDLSRSHGDFEATKNLARLLQQLEAFARGELSN
ncbi:tetratricopeptide repeat protein [Scytonema sp. UIC 10036]|uniref:tetratricopeptide repeat protein n=1 Tax=Scytonema sp. UIC 10036 TaxID=2304196 RepID=UPI0012DA1162|nr:tetratricopeptide repeat protein [Scytonema sp. UIC 10036]MUG91243.1 tetratricopeptide repeat protein [Scytonema sp. UIC 10036]